MPKFENRSVPIACARVEISTASTPPMRIDATSPSGTIAPAKVWCASGTQRITSTSASTGGPENVATLPPNRNGSRAPSPASNASRTAIGSQIGATAAPCTPRAIRRCRKVVLSEGAPPPALSVVSAITIGPSGCGQRRVDRAIDVMEVRRRLLAQRDQLTADLFGEPVAVRLGAVGDHQDARAAFRHVAIGKAVTDRDREHAVLALQRHDAVDQGAHRLPRGREAREQAAVEHRFHRLDLAADGAQREIDRLFAARSEIGVRILLEQHDDVGERAALLREMAMRIELDADHAVRADQRAHPLEKIAFAVVIAVRHHRAVQVEHRAVDRQRGLQLAEDFVAHPLIGGARGRAARLRRVAGALDQLEFAALRARPHRVHRAGLVARRARDICRAESRASRRRPDTRSAAAGRCSPRARARRRTDAFDDWSFRPSSPREGGRVQ